MADDKEKHTERSERTFKELVQNTCFKKVRWANNALYTWGHSKKGGFLLSPTPILWGQKHIKGTECHLAPRSWYLNTILRQKELGLLKEMDSKSGAW